MYKLTRQEVANKLSISTRSVDRYIKAWKLRSKKEWKVVYINQNDVINLMWGWNTNQVIYKQKEEIKPKKEEKVVKITKHWDEGTAWTLWEIYKDLKQEIQKKDTLIQNLAMRVGKAEEVAKNSVTLIDFKKSQYLLEESKENVNKELDETVKEKEKLEVALKYEKTSNLILIVFVVLLLAVAWIIWFMKI